MIVYIDVTILMVSERFADGFVDMAAERAV